MLCQYIATLPSNNTKETIGTYEPKLVDGKKTYIFHKKQTTPTAITTIVIKGKMEYNNRNELLMDAIGQLLRIVYTEKVREIREERIAYRYRATCNTTPTMRLCYELHSKQTHKNITT